MNRIATEINELIKSSEEYKNYLYFKELVDKSVDLRNLKKKLNELKESNCKNKSDELVNEYHMLEKKYSENRYVKEYNLAKDELRDLIIDICDILSLK